MAHPIRWTRPKSVALGSQLNFLILFYHVLLSE
jgi:hypothetical protein